MKQQLIVAYALLPAVLLTLAAPMLVAGVAGGVGAVVIAKRFIPGEQRLSATDHVAVFQRNDGPVSEH